MIQTKNTKRALLISILSVLVCCAMLIGITFAWFTDSVTSGNNTIVAGNLDVELYHTSASVTEEEKVTDTTSLFVDQNGDSILWEPGVMVYENFTITNKGNLALKYQLSMNLGSFNTVADTEKSLKDVLKVAVVENGFAGDRTTIPATDFTSLADFIEEGTLLATDEAKTFGVVIYWEPSSIDNDYNLNDGITTSDGEPLYIDLGINVVATQAKHESDSFDSDYDVGATYPIVDTQTAVDALKDNTTKNIEIANDIVITPEIASERVNISSDKNINFNDNTVTRQSGTGNGIIIGERGYNPYPVTVIMENATFVSETSSAVVRVESGSTVTFRNCTFIGREPFQARGDGTKTTLIFENCTFEGQVNLDTGSASEFDVTFRNCTFTGSFGNGGTSVYIDARAYGSVVLEDCDIDITYTGNGVSGINIGSYYSSNGNNATVVTLRNTNINIDKDPSITRDPTLPTPVRINAPTTTDSTLVIEGNCTFTRNGQTATYNSVDKSWSYT